MMRLCVLALFLLAGSPVLGQSASRPRTSAPPELAATVQFAPGGDLVGPWQGFSVDLDSRTRRELDLTLRIEDDSFAAVATRRERLSPGARKRVFLYSPGGVYPRGIPPRYRISDAAGQELSSGIVSINPRGYVPNVFQVGLFSKSNATDQEFGMPSGYNGQEIRYCRIAPDTLPDRWAALVSLDLIVLHDAPLDKLTTEQARALVDYVRRGGTIVLSPGLTKGSLGPPVLAPVAPVRAGEPRVVSDLPGLTAAHGPLRRPEPFLVHPILNGQPYGERIGREIATFPSGFGRVHVLSFDLLRAPFDTWAGRRGLWSDLLGASPRWFAEDRAGFPGASTQKQRMEMFQQMARLINPYPSFLLILALAAVFILTVGPLNYLVLWKLRRTLLLVVTVPGISIVFLVAIVALGYVLKGTATVVHSARLLTTRSGLDCAREIQLYSLFSPATRNYDLSCEPGTFAQPPGRWGLPEEHYYRRESAATLTVESAAGITLRGLGAGQWQSWDIEARALRDFGKGVSFEPAGGSVRIVNGSPRQIERGLFVQTGGPDVVLIPFGPVAPGQSAEARADGPRLPPLVALGIPPDSLGSRLLRPWLDTIARRPRQDASLQAKPARFLVCVLKDEGEPLRVDAPASSRSRAVTLLHVAEARP